MLRNALAAFSAAAILLSAGCATTTGSYAPYDGYAVPSGPPHGVASVYAFEEVLSPWGQWLYLDGVRVWRPYSSVVGRDFVPYATGGRWVYTDYGWTFDSRWEWGWATFHYGWWVLSPVYGWVWVPGTQWAPAWVIWRHGGGYIGWAPFAPSFAFGYYDPFWMFVDTGYFVHYDVYRYCVPRSRVPRLWAATTPIRPIARGTTRVIGPPPGEVREVVGRIPRAEIIPPPEGVIARPRIVAEGLVRALPEVERPSVGGSGLPPVAQPVRPIPEVERPELVAPARPVPEIEQPDLVAPVRPVPEIERPDLVAPVRPAPEVERPEVVAPVRPVPGIERPERAVPVQPPPPVVEPARPAVPASPPPVAEPPRPAVPASPPPVAEPPRPAAPASPPPVAEPPRPAAPASPPPVAEPPRPAAPASPPPVAQPPRPAAPASSALVVEPAGLAALASTPPAG